MGRRIKLTYINSVNREVKKVYVWVRSIDGEGSGIDGCQLCPMGTMDKANNARCCLCRSL